MPARMRSHNATLASEEARTVKLRIRAWLLISSHVSFSTFEYVYRVQETSKQYLKGLPVMPYRFLQKQQASHIPIRRKYIDWLFQI